MNADTKQTRKEELFIKSVDLQLSIFSILVVMDISEPIEEHFKHEPNEKSGASQNEIPFGHIIFSQFLVDYQIIIMFFCFDALEVVNDCIFGA